MKRQFTFTKLFLAGLLVLGFAMPVLADQNPQATHPTDPVYVDWWDEFLDGPDSTVDMTVEENAKAQETLTSGSISHNDGSMVKAMESRGQGNLGSTHSGSAKGGKVQVKYDSSWMIDEDW